jgi:2-polyprenyl-3-methyl-5-hydroxy-6-metoxy-1,4-benzoquinol methylase
MVVDGISCIGCGCDVSAVQFDSLVDYLTDDLFSIHRCKQCQLQYTYPLPAGADIGRYYPPRYRGNRHSFTGKIRSALRRRAVESCFPKHFRGKILDIGCGDGTFALEMKANGWDVSATELDAQTIANLASQGINAKLSHEALASGFATNFDAITCWHVLEHVESPQATIDWAKSLLAPQGVFQPTVPNVACLQAKLFGRHWMHLDVPRHRQHFTPATLRSMLEKAGFVIEKQTNVAIEYDWFGVIQSALNGICVRQNVLFDKMTKAVVDPARKSPMTDVAISYALAPFLAAASLPAISIGALLGDGATLTFTCR